MEVTRHRRTERYAGKRPHMPYWILAVDVALLLALLAVCGGIRDAGQAVDAIYREREEAHIRILENHPRKYLNLIEEMGEEYNIKPAFLLAIVLNESSFRTTAQSNVGARGLMQVMEDTGEWVALKLGVNDYNYDRLFEEELNLRFGTWYMRYLADRFRGDPILVACAYHAGPGSTEKWLNQYSEDGLVLDIEMLQDGPTKSYAKRIFRDYAIYEQLYYTQHDDTL